MGAMNLDNIVGIAIICAVGLIAAVQTAVFVKDISFYRSIGWDFSRDSGNRLYLLEALRQSPLFRKCPPGYLRFSLGIQYLAVGLLIFYGAVYWLMNSAVGE